MSTVRLEWSSPCGPSPGPLPRSPVGSVLGPRVTTPAQMPFVAAAASSIPLSSELMSVSGLATVTVEERRLARAPAGAKFALSAHTL